jgi:hypothetical protein
MAALSVHSCGEGMKASNPAARASSPNSALSLLLRATPPQRIREAGRNSSTARVTFSRSARTTAASKLARKSGRRSGRPDILVSPIHLKAAVFRPLKLKSRLWSFILGRAKANLSGFPPTDSRSITGPPG